MRETIRLHVLILLAGILSIGGSAHAAFHLWYVQQLYSNADGSVQFIELRAMASGQQFVSGHTLRVTQGSNVHTFTMPRDLPGDTANMSGDGGYGYYMPMMTFKSMVIGTQGFAALNAITPDYVVPNGFLFAGGGILNWGEGSDMWNYATLPTDGTNALNRDGSTGPAMATNFMGDSAPIHLSTANTPLALTGVWWNSNESGWGLYLTQRGSNVFAAWYTFDASGNPKWYVSVCPMNGGGTGTTGTCSGTVEEDNGPTFFGTTFDPSRLTRTNTGTLQLAFSGPDNATMTYSGVAGQSRTLAISRTPFATGAVPGVNYTDLWWNAGESGWGLAITQQASTLFLAWYVYDGSGKPTWYTAACIINGTSCSGDVLRTTGPAFGPTFDTHQVQNSKVGTISVNFTDANNATIDYTVNGVSGSKRITRALF